MSWRILTATPASGVSGTRLGISRSLVSRRGLLHAMVVGVVELRVQEVSDRGTGSGGNFVAGSVISFDCRRQVGLCLFFG